MNKRVRTVKDPAVAAAEKLWDKLRTDLLGVNKTIIEIIEQKAWEPLGYESFEKAWVDKLSGIDFSAAVLPHIVYAMYDEGMTPDEVADIVPSVGPTRAENLARQKKNNVPARDARPDSRPRPQHRDEHYTVWLHPGPERFRRWVEVANRLGRPVSEIVIEAADKMFEELDRVG